MADWLYNHGHRSLFRQMHPKKTGGGAVCGEIRTGGQWSKKEQYLRINQLELLVIKFAILTFAKMWKLSAIHIQVDNMTALTYLLKMGGTKNPELMQISKEVWGFLLGQGITITAEHLPGNLNCKADWESRHQKDSSEWKLYPLVFGKICQILGKKPEIDLFASRLSNQLPSYYSWKPDQDSLGTDALQQKWYHKSLYAFPLFALIHKVLKKAQEEKVPSLIIVTPSLQTQIWYPELLRLSVRNLIILPLKEDLLKGPQNQQHPLIQNRTMQLAVWLVSGSVWQR